MGWVYRNKLFRGFSLSWSGGRWTYAFTVGLQWTDHLGFNPGIWFMISETDFFRQCSLFDEYGE